MKRIPHTAKQRRSIRIWKAAEKITKIIMEARSKMTPREIAKADRNTAKLIAKVKRRRRRKNLLKHS